MSTSVEKASSPRQLRRLYTVLVSVSVLLCMLPLATTAYLPLVDYPNHLARCFVLLHHNDITQFRETYAVDVTPVPNVAMDLLVPPVALVTGPYLAGRLFVAMVILLFAWGIHVFSSALNRGSHWAAPGAILLSYNSFLFMGFLNYLFGLSVFLLAFGYWLRWYENLDRKRWLVFTALTFAAYLSHLTAYAFLIVSTTVFIGFEQRKNYTLMLRTAVSLLLPAIAFVAFMRGSGDVGRLTWAPLLVKLVALFPFFISYGRFFDLAILVALVVVGWLSIRQGVDVRRAGLSVAVLLLICFAFSPIELMTSSGADARLVPPAFLFMLFSVSSRMSTPHTLRVVGLFVIILAVRHFYILWNWTQMSAKIGRAVDIVRLIPEGQRIYIAYYPPAVDTPENKPGRALAHVGAYAVIERSAVISNLFAKRGQQPVVYRNPMFSRLLTSRSSDNDRQQLRQFDYAVSILAPDDARRLLDSSMIRVAEAENVILWKKRPETTP